MLIRADIEHVQIQIVGVSEKDTLFVIEPSEAESNGESIYQIVEGHSYEYSVTEGYLLQEIGGIVSQSKLNKGQGRITPNIYVGTLSIEVINETNNEQVGTFSLEVRSVKTTYRQDYRIMLEEITEKCTELLMQANSPVSQYFIVNFNSEPRIIYQRFAFIKSILESDEFNDAVHKFLISPITKWTDTEIQKDIRGVRKIDSKRLRQIASASNRINLPEGHLLKERLSSIPLKIQSRYKTETVDTPENRFIKYALESFLIFCSEFYSKAGINDRLRKEANFLVEKIESYLGHSLFKEIFSLVSFPTNSPVLQRKEGYREIFRMWLMFDLAAKLVWHGGDEIYSANKKDVAILYEYWLFFKLLDLITDVFKIGTPKLETLIEETDEGLGLRLKQGRHLRIEGIFESANMKLNVEFSYNRTFSGESKYPTGGSWTRSLRPDYTLSIWPHGIEMKQADDEELVVHIHFDAKYRVENLTNIFGYEDNLDEEKLQQVKGTYKRADLLKMHTYRDAIRRTAGAYILYPGSESNTRLGFHELLPGLGAFAIRPSKSDSGLSHLRDFLKEVVQHFLNRASQREKIALKYYQIYKDKDQEIFNNPLPPAYGQNRALLPDETYVLVAFYKDEQHLKWILRNRLYNTRTGTRTGSLHLGVKEAGASYLLLHTSNELLSARLMKLASNGPRIFSKQDMINKGYSDPTQDFYLLYDIEGRAEEEFSNMKWDISKLIGYSKGRASALPFAVTITQLMKALIKQ